MPGTPTARLALATLEGSDDVQDFPLVSAAQMEKLDDVALYLPPGPLAALPAAADVRAGSMYYATDGGMALMAVGSGLAASAWVTITSPGELLCMAVPSTPLGYLPANGAVFSPSTYPFLYAAIGTTYGGSSSSPLLPDLRGRIPIGTGTGTAVGASAWSLGQTPTSGRGGEETHALTIAELPSHSHTIYGAATGVSVETGHASVETGYANMGGSTFSLGAMSVNNAVAGGFYWGAVNGNEAENYAVARGTGGYSVFGYGNTEGYGFDLLNDNGHSHSISYSYDIYDSGHSHGDAGHGHGISDPTHTHSMSSVGSNAGHNNVAPVTALNWFIKT